MKEKTIDISSNIPIKSMKVFEQYHSIFSLFPSYKDIHAQIKLTSLEIIKIHMAESEHRVAHLILKSICEEYPQDPYLWNMLGKLYLDIGKRQAAVTAFEKSEEVALTKQPEFASFIKFFSRYSPNNEQF